MLRAVLSTTAIIPLGARTMPRSTTWSTARHFLPAPVQGAPRLASARTIGLTNGSRLELARAATFDSGVSTGFCVRALAPRVTRDGLAPALAAACFALAFAAAFEHIADLCVFEGVPPVRACDDSAGLDAGATTWLGGAVCDAAIPAVISAIHTLCLS